MYKYELHMHTSECDRDAYLSARELVHLYKNAGYDGMVVTDHCIERFCTLWFPEEVTGLTHEQQVTRWLKGDRTAREEGLAKNTSCNPMKPRKKRWVQRLRSWVPMPR